MAAQDWSKEVDWAGIFKVRARQLRFRIDPTVLSRIEQEIRAKNELIESRDQLILAIRALSEDAVEAAKKAGRTRVNIADLEAALRKCRVWPFC